MEISNLLNYMEKNGKNYISVMCKNQQKVYFKELKKDVLKVINYIENERKINKGEYIGIIGDNSYEWILIDLACLIGGWVLVSFHEKDFQDNKVNLLNLYNMRLVFTDANYTEKSPKYVCLESVTEIIKNSSEEYVFDPKFVFDKKDIFTIIYTSGTTGMPKALKINIQGVNSFINGFFDIFEFTREDNVLVFLPLSVLTCRTYIYAAIMGGTNVLLANMSTFILAMKLGKPTVLQGVPHLFETVYDTINNVLDKEKKKKILLNLFFVLKRHNLLGKKLVNQVQKKYLKAFHDFWGGEMRLMITGSASISKKIINFYNDAGIPLYEAYGINEGGVLAINSPHNVRVGSVGRPFMNRSIKIAEDGEVLVKRDKYTFSSGYFDEELNSKNDIFRDDGYIATGDIGKFDNDGFLYLIGRKKEILILSNGEKIMPAQIENEIKELPEIKQICICGNEKSFLTAIVFPADNKMKQKEILERIRQLNGHVKNIDKIQAVIVAKELFSVENKMLNVNLKLARKEIEANYMSQLREIYGDR